MDDVIATTPELKPDGEYYGGYMRSSGGDWEFCLKILHELWDVPQTATCWLQLTRTRKPHSWKIRLDHWSGYRRYAIFFDPDCPCRREELVARLGIANLMGRVVPLRKKQSPELYVRLFYREA